MSNIGKKPVLSQEKLLTTVGFSFGGDVFMQWKEVFTLQAQ